MNRPTKENPRIKYLGKTRKGLPVYQWCVTYQVFNERINQWVYKQVWLDHKPTKEDLEGLE